MTESPTQQPVVIRVLGDGSRCLVQDSFVALSDIPNHLQIVLGLSPGAPISVRADPDAKFEPVHRVLTSLKDAGFHPGMAIL